MYGYLRTARFKFGILYRNRRSNAMAVAAGPTAAARLQGRACQDLLRPTFYLARPAISPRKIRGSMAAVVTGAVEASIHRETSLTE